MKQNVIHKMRKGMMVLFTFFILHFSFFIFMSCSDEPAAENYYVFNGEMVSDYLVNREETFSDFIAILNRSGMYGMMATYGTYTCLAPTNDAVELYLKEHGKSSVDELTKAECDTIAWNHIIKYAYFPYNQNIDILNKGLGVATNPIELLYLK